jgi:hypothetical protein
MSDLPAKMSQPDLSEITKSIQNSFQYGDYVDALRIAEEGFRIFSDQSPLFYFWQITLNAALGSTSTSLDLLDLPWMRESGLRTFASEPDVQCFSDLPRFHVPSPGTMKLWRMILSENTRCFSCIPRGAAMLVVRPARSCLGCMPMTARR